MNPQVAPSREYRQGPLETLVGGFVLSLLTLLIVPAILGGKILSAQTDATQGTNPAQQKTTKTAAATMQHQQDAGGTATQPTVSTPPIRPADQSPNPATLSWDSRGLEIEASNSSLNQILHQVAADTGAKLEGLAQDQRVFGNYGPGPVSDVLSKLLDGSGYNVLMISSRDADTPLAIVLSARLPASAQTAASNQNHSNLARSEQPRPEPQPENPPEPQRSQASQDPFNVGGPPRDPQQFMQEIVDRQHQIDQQQEQQNNQKQ